METLKKKVSLKEKSMMNYSVMFLAGCLCLASCVNNEDAKTHFREVDPSKVHIVEGIETGGGDTVLVENIAGEFPIEVLLADVYYIPLETTDESHFTENRKTIVYKDRIYIMDDVDARAVLIFDMNGKFLRRLGRKGDASDKLSRLSDMTVDEKNGRLVLFDGGKKKLVHFTLEGDYVKTTDVNFDFPGQMEYLPSGNMVAAVSKSEINTHLGGLDEYRILQSDSLGNIIQAGFKRDDNNNLKEMHERLFKTGNDIVYYSPFINKLYTINNNAVAERFVIKYKDNQPVDLDEFQAISNVDSARNYLMNKAYISSDGLVENSNHLYFSTKGKDSFYTIYDKNVKKYIAFRNFGFYFGFVIDPSLMYAYEDYFIGQATAEQIIAMREHLEKTYRPISPLYQEMYDTIQKDDNPVLIFFKMKDFSVIKDSTSG